MGDCAPLPAGPFDIAVIDPPWRFAANSADKPGRTAHRHYPVMSDAEIAAMPIDAMLAKDALAFLWTTVPMLERSMTIARGGWGLRYVSHFAWDKGRVALGYWIRNRHELCLLYKRGALARPESKAPFTSSLIVERAGSHSAKPAALQDMIDAAYPAASKVELFARRVRPGWTVWGDQAPDEGGGDG